MALHIYLPQDRLRALARGETLPDRTNGAALFADISGFTALTEGLRNALGPRRGAEELTRRIEAVYSPLITQIELFGGSVIDFAGDSMSCWFDEDLSLVAEVESLDAVSLLSAAHRAVACGVALQRAMRAFAKIVLPDQSTTALTLKVAIASGAARRFVVGDPKIHLMDALAGATIARTATAEHHAQKGEVIVDTATVTILGDDMTIQEWREDAESGERFAVIGALTRPIEVPVLMQPDTGYLVPEELHPWLHAPLVERERSGQAAFMTEFRPCAAMFILYTGIDFDQETAGPQLDGFIRRMQAIVGQHGATILQLTIGDKGSYVYINFGALSAHEDDTKRAVNAALELSEAARQLDFLQPLQIGITQGTLRVGAYGGHTRKTFGALGDEVNLSARLMTNAAPGEILLSSHVHKAVEANFVFEPRPPLAMKGKAEPVPVFALTGKRKERAIRLQEPSYALPMVGRAKELQIIEEKLDLVLSGKSQIIGIIAEAGMGKSRLVAEVIRLAHRKGFVGYGGACQSDGIHTPYLAWKSIWGAFFDIDPSAPLKKQMRLLEGEIEDRVPSRLEAMPLLNVVLDLDIPENDFTRNLEPKIRQSALHALLEDCLKAAAKETPLLLVLEDLHWIDALSHDLLDGLAKALADHPVCFLLAYRPPQITRLQAPRIEALPQSTRIELHELSKAEAESAIRAKLAQMYPARGGALPTGLVDTLMSRTQGNPFYLEELLNYLRDRGLDPHETSALEKIELPDSLHALILSRIDQLTEREKTILRVASIVGRLFRAAWLTGYYPALGDLAHIKVDLDKLESLDITPLDSPEPELAYLFKHIVTHEVTYESLPFDLRAQLHEQLAHYLEKQAASGTMPESALLETLAFHYSRSANTTKQREYLRKAGEAAQKNFANDAALDFYGSLLSLFKEAQEHARERAEIHLRRGQVLELMGKWGEAESDYRAALELGGNEAAGRASAQFALGKLNRLRGEYRPALDWLAQANETCATLEDRAGLAEVHIERGRVLSLKGEYAQARESLNEGLVLAREVGDALGAAQALNNLGNIAQRQSNFAAARALYEESLGLRREVGDKEGISASLNNLAIVAQEQGDYAAGRALHEESLRLKREMGMQRGIAVSLTNLGSVAQAQGDYAAARALFEESRNLFRDMGDKGGIASSLIYLGNVAQYQGDYSEARARFEESLALYREIGDKRGTTYALSALGIVAYEQGNYPGARALYGESLALGQAMDAKFTISDNLLGLGLVGLAENDPGAGEHILHSLRLRQETGQQLGQISSLVGMAGLALHEGDAAHAAQWLGAVESALKTLNAAMEPDHIRFHARTLSAVKAQLGEAAFQAAWEAGSQWTLEQAVKRALA